MEGGGAEVPLMAGTLHVWEGFWAGWRERHSIIKGNRLLFYTAESGGLPCGEVVFAPGCTLDFSLLAEADETDPAQQDGTSLSFTLRGSGPTRHVHLRAPTAALRDRWVIALQLSAAAIGDDSTVAASVRLAHHIGVVRMAHEVLLSQTARLAEFAEALGQYPEILSLLGDSRIGSMLTSSTISTCTDAVQWVSDLEGQYEAAMEREAEAQQQLVELAQSLAGMGHTQLENIADGLDSEVDQSNQENGHDPVLGGHHDGSNWLQQLELYQEASRAQASLLVSRAATVRTLARSLAGAPTDPTAPPVSITVGSVSSMSRTPSIQSLPPIAARRNTSQTAMWESASAYGAAQQQRQTPTHLYPPPATSTYSQSNTPIMQASSAGTLVGAAMCSVRDSCGEMVRFLASHLVYLHAQYRRSVQRTHALQRRILAGVSKTGGGDDRPLDKNDPQRLSTLYAQATMSVSVSDVYEAFFGHSPTGLLALYAQLRYFDIQIGTWSSDGLTAQRTNKFSANIDTPLGQKLACNVEEQTITWRPDKRGFVIESRVTSPNVPYGQTFYNRARYYVADIGAGQSHVEMSGELVWVAKPYFGTVCNMIESQASGAMKEYADRFRECVLKFQLQEGLTSASDEQKHTGREAERKEGPTRRHLHRTASKNAPPPVTGGNGGSVPLFQALGGVCAVLAVGSLALALHLRRSSH